MSFYAKRTRRPCVRHKHARGGGGGWQRQGCCLLSTQWVSGTLHVRRFTPAWPTHPIAPTFNVNLPTLSASSAQSSPSATRQFVHTPLPSALDTYNVSAAINQIVEDATLSKFESTNNAQDEIVLLNIVQVGRKQPFFRQERDVGATPVVCGAHMRSWPACNIWQPWWWSHGRQLHSSRNHALPRRPLLSSGVTDLISIFRGLEIRTQRHLRWSQRCCTADALNGWHQALE
eukprot:354260-Chlamydomonas_euryale.AAC.4